MLRHLITLAGACLFAAVCCATSGCGSRAGAFWYFFGPQQQQIVKARFKLTTGSLLILFDESTAVDTPPDVYDVVVQSLTDEFGRRDINKQVVPLARVHDLRRQGAEVNDRGRLRGIRELGRKVNAEQVLWMHPKEFSMSDTPETSLDPAKLSVAVKVINAQAEDREQLRLWPVSEDGELVNITVSPADVRRTKTRNELIKKMADKLAVEIGCLFRDYDAADPEFRKH
jgi:hypothetical protein